MSESNLLGIGRPLNEDFVAAVSDSMLALGPDARYRPRKTPGYMLADDSVLRIENLADWQGVQDGVLNAASFVEGVLLSLINNRKLLVAGDGSFSIGEDLTFKRAGLNSKSGRKASGAWIQLVVDMVDEEPFTNSWQAVGEQFAIQKGLGANPEVPGSSTPKIRIVMGSMSAGLDRQRIPPLGSWLPAPTLLPPALLKH